MVKFENQVTYNKISHFVNTTSLIIIFNCTEKAAFLEKNSSNIHCSNFLDFLQKSCINKADSTRLEKHGVKQDIGSTWWNSISMKNQDISSDSVEKVDQSNSIRHTDKNFTIVTLKNNYFKKALVSRITKMKPSSSFLKKNSLIQGNRLAILVQPHQMNRLAFIKDILQLESLKKTENASCISKADSLASKYKKKQSNVLILGGIYENKIIDHNQIKRLLENSEDNQLYSNLHFNLTSKQSFLLSLCNFHGKHKIIILLKFLYLAKKQQENP